LVANGTLPATDARKVEALKRRWNIELGSFRQWSGTAQRATVKDV
jgi:hypothetical protein